MIHNQKQVRGKDKKDREKQTKQPALHFENRYCSTDRATVQYRELIKESKAEFIASNFKSS